MVWVLVMVRAQSSVNVQVWVRVPPHSSNVPVQATQDLTLDQAPSESAVGVLEVGSGESRSHIAGDGDIAGGLTRWPAEPVRR